MTIAPVLNIEREKIGPLRILMRIDDVVYVCNCTFYSYVLKNPTQRAFVYDIYFSKKDKSACRGEIIYNRTYTPLFLLEVKNREIKATLKNMLQNFFEDTCIVKYAFKVTSYVSP